MKVLCLILTLLAILAVYKMPLAQVNPEEKGLDIEKSEEESPTRVALVIGNAAYRNISRLKNPIHDAQDMKAVLKKLGFEVIYCENGTKSQINDAKDTLAEKVENKEVVVYYSGHGVQLEGKNYILPIDVKITSQHVLKTTSIKLDDILEAIGPAEKKVLILDACRNTPNLPKNEKDIFRGLASMQSTGETIIVFATAPGCIASDNESERNGLFTACLLKEISKEGEKIEDCLKTVNRLVEAKSNGKQQPWCNSSLKSDFYFNPKKADKIPSVPGINPAVSEERPGEIMIESAPEEIVKDSELILELRIGKKEKRTWYEIIGTNIGASGQIKIELIYPKGMRNRLQESKMCWNNLEIKAGQKIQLQYKGFEAVSPGEYEIICRAYQKTDMKIIGEEKAKIKIEESLFEKRVSAPSYTPDLPKPTKPSEPVKPAVSPVKPPVPPAEETYGLPQEVWRACQYEYQGAKYLDMTTEYWVNLGWQKQSEYATAYQKGYAGAKGIALEKTINLPNLPSDAKPLKMILIPPGRFWQGSPDNETSRDSDEGPRHKVLIPFAYYLSEYECTQAQWQAVMGNNPSYFKNAGPDAPVEQVSWDEVANGSNSFCGKTGLLLPTESMWEYACRAGTTGMSYEGDFEIKGYNNAPGLSGIAWYGGNSGVSYEGGYDSSSWSGKEQNHTRAGTHRVGEKRPNGYGLYDMLGNVWELCADTKVPYQSQDIVTQRLTSIVPITSAVIRGGSWFRGARYPRCAYRNDISADNRDRSLGFRLSSLP